MRLPDSMIPSVRAIVAGTRAGSAIGSRGTKKTPSGKRSATALARATAESRLAHAAGPGQGQQAGPVDEARELRQLGLAPDQAGELRWQVVGPAVDRPEGRELRDQAVDHQVAEPLRTKVLERVLAEIPNRHARQRRTPDEGPGHGRQDDLGPGTGRADPRRPVDIRPDVAPIAIQDAGPRVDAHPDADLLAGRPRLGLQPALGVNGRRDRRAGRREHDEERVALGRDLDPVSRRDHAADDRAVTRERGLIPLSAEAVEEGGGTLDVREQEGHRTGRARGGPDGRAATQRAAPFAAGAGAPSGPNSSWARATAAAWSIAIPASQAAAASSGPRAARASAM